MHLFMAYVPILVFVAVFFTADIYWATGALMVLVTLLVAWQKLRGKPVDRVLNVTFWVTIVFGGMTLVLRDETFIQWKPTVVNWLLATALVGGHFVRTNLIQKLLGSQLKLPDPVWAKLSLGWAAGFCFAGILNLVVAYNFSMEFWVIYKPIGGFGLTLLYIALTLFYIHWLGLLVPPKEVPATSAPSAAGEGGAGA